MKLSALLAGWLVCPERWDKEIRGLALHSQQVQLGDLFIALAGDRQDGRRYVEEAVQRGAAAVLCEERGLDDFSVAAWGPIPVLSLPNLRVCLEDIAVKFYGDPGASLKIVGVTGTNGKTTSTFLLAQTQTRLGVRTAVLGTLGYGMVGQLHATNLTTPDPVSLQKYLAQLQAAGVKAVAMEVSSHGLAQNRVKSLRFESALFTNLTQDHLDYHQTMEDYGQAKARLFRVPSLRRAIINADSEYAEKMLSATRSDLPVVWYSQRPEIERKFSKEREWWGITVQDFAQNAKGIMATVKTPWGTTVLRSALFGQFNLSNLLGVLGELCAQGFSLSEVTEALALALPPPGRMQRLGGVRDPLILIDYAHTPDALENALKAARLHTKRRLWCVFGCGGERDKDKREKMGKLAGQWADNIILTNDNPRREDPTMILDNILQGFSIKCLEKVVVEADRAKAIHYVLTHALPVDTVLIAGKGHEDYQDIGGRKIPFSDVSCVEKILAKGEGE